MSVVLPAPFSPTTAWISPGWSVRSTPSRATTRSNRLLMPRIATSGGPVVSRHGRHVGHGMMGGPEPGRATARSGSLALRLGDGAGWAR